MKKLAAMLLIATMAVSMVGCGSKKETSTESTVAQTTEEATTEETITEEATTEAEKPETITITGLNGNKEEVQVTIPYDPQRIAILDMASLDIIDALGLGERVVGSATTSIEYLADYAPSDTIANLGTIKTADLEAVMACEPDVIFIGGRLSSSYDALSEIAPVVYLPNDYENVSTLTETNAKTIASLFGMEEKIDEMMAGYADRIAALAEVANGKTAIVGMCTGGSFNVLGNDGRCSIIGLEIGYENVGVEANIDTSTHGNEASFEYIVEKAPDYIFVMDRDAAIQTEGVQLAQEIMENELVMGTEAYKNGNIVYLAHPNVWYTAEGGIQALDIMLQDLEAGLLK